MRPRLFHVATATFEAARRLPALPPGHRAARRHGHSFRARVCAALPAGWAPFPGGETQALEGALTDAVAALDYRDLNELLAFPSDENLARWLGARLPVPGIASVGIRSACDQGADLDSQGQVRLWRRFRFEAAHRLPHVPAGHKCGRMHGHGFEVVLHAERAGGDAGAGVHTDRLEQAWAPWQERLHHACLNDLPGLANPTSEVLASWLWERLRPELPSLSRVGVFESATAGCGFDGRSWQIFKERGFDSALRLARAPEGNPVRRLHGHGYGLRLYLTAPLDPVLGWVMDYADIKERFDPLLAGLDHHRLDELPGLADADPASLLLWLREAALARIPRLDRMDLLETPGRGAVLCLGDEAPDLSP